MTLIKTAVMAATSIVGDSPLFLIDYVMRFARVAILLALWRTLAGSRAEVGGMTLAALLTYTLIADVFAEQLAPRSELDNEMWQGAIAPRFLRPMSLVTQYGADMVGRWCIGLAFFSLPLMVAAPLLGVDPRPAGVMAGGLFLISLGIGVTVGLAIEFIVAAGTVALDFNLHVANTVRMAVGTLLSGALLPLAVLPWGLGNVFTWLPFASMASAPLRIYTGTGEPLFLLSLQIGWAIVLWLVAERLWRAHREKLAFYGG